MSCIKRFMSNLSLFLVSAIVLFTGSVSAGEISDNLKSAISGKVSSEFVRVVIVPNSTHNTAAMKASLIQRYQTRSERHVAAVSELKEVARTSQADIKTLLTEMVRGNQAQNVKAFWIDNVIEAEIRISALQILKEQQNINKIEIYPEIVSIPTTKSSGLALGATSAESNLLMVNADVAWAQGYDGTGRIVCSFDSGVDGDHPALKSNYRGNKGYAPSECWFSPVDTSTYPHYFINSSSREHGTHTTGIMIGRDIESGDTIGVAPGADWIAAATIDIPGVSIFEAFQWAADPDGNPNTISDLPDVINNSWGITQIGCTDLLWNLIDNVEALGIVVIFSAGNEGSNASTLRNPGNRADDSLTNFAVGAVSKVDSSIWSHSSRGPSDCDGVSIKPNVVAPGVLIRSSEPNNAYVWRTGTSMAAPHVSGAVAILRQKNPNATVTQIKTALLNSAVDLGEPGLDNTYGWGMIDIAAALDEIDALTSPLIKTAGFENPEFNPGGQYQLTVSLKNTGADAANVNASFSTDETGIISLSTSLSFGIINNGQTIPATGTFDIYFDDTASAGLFYTVDMTITADGGYETTQKLSFYLGAKGERTYYHHDNEQIKFSISNYGAFGFHADSYIPYGFSGFQFNSEINCLYEGAFVVGVDSSHISDCARNVAQEPDNDFAVIHGGTLASEEPGVFADQETTSIFDDSFAENPIGLRIKQRSYMWSSPPDNEYLILEYIMTNIADTAILGFRTALYMDWDTRDYNKNHSNYYPGENVGYIYWVNSSISPTDSTDFRGVRILNPEGIINHRVYLVGPEVSNSNFHEGRKYQGLFDNSRLNYFSTPFDLSHMTATGPFYLAPGESDTAAFAIIGGLTWDDFISNAVLAQQKYDDLPTDTDDENITLPLQFTLHQNFPNPFNPATTISFSLPKAGEVIAQVFDILGREVRTLSNSYYPAGEHELFWDGKNKDGQSVASGVYFYRVRHDSENLTRKMVLMK
ncbi:MAG: S8 family serine peptidase [candidate division Zixibacteria bacterium]|nr:S8 family serine peptidase [candidate division Zixibacteria bacterium]